MRVGETTRSELRAYVRASDKPVAALAAELGVSRTTIRRWRASNRPDQPVIDPGADRASPAIPCATPSTLPMVHPAHRAADLPGAGKRPSTVGLSRYALALWLLGAVVYAASTQAFVRASELFAQKDQTVGVSVKRPASAKPTTPPRRDAAAERTAQVQAPTAVAHTLAASTTNAPSPVKRDAASDAGGEWVEVTGSGVNLRAAPTSGSRVVTVRSHGTKLRIVSQERSGWVEVLDPESGQKGWIFRKYAKPSTSPGDDRTGTPAAATKNGQQSTQF